MKYIRLFPCGWWLFRVWSWKIFHSLIRTNFPSHVWLFHPYKRKASTIPESAGFSDKATEFSFCFPVHNKSPVPERRLHKMSNPVHSDSAISEVRLCKFFDRFDFVRGLLILWTLQCSPLINDNLICIWTFKISNNSNLHNTIMP